jgi:hypothetical protein
LEYFINNGFSNRVSFGKLLALSGRVENLVSQLYPLPHRFIVYLEWIIDEYNNIRWESHGPEFLITNLHSFVDSVIDDIKLGLIQSLPGLIRGDLFEDYIQMSEHLLDEGYKDAAAVIIGSSLEAHLKSLCKSNDVEYLNKDGEPLKSSQINQNLYSVSVYGKREMKQIVSWLEVRNYAAHGDYEQYDEDDVRLLIEGIALFIERYPS